jgi:hypothetical protein
MWILVFACKLKFVRGRGSYIQVSTVCNYLFKAHARLDDIYESSLYLKENTTLHHYKDQLGNAV